MAIKSPLLMLAVAKAVLMVGGQKRVFGWAWVAISCILFGCWWFLGREYDHIVLFNTVVLGLAAAAISIPFGWGLAITALHKSLLGRVTLLLVFSFALVPIVFQVSCWDSAFGKLGWITAQVTGTNQPIISGWMATIWIHAVSLSPQIALLFMVATSCGQKVYEEQALVDSSSWQVFMRVTLPRMVPVIGGAVCWSIISCSREIAVTDIYQVGTLAEQVYLGFSLGQFDSVIGLGAASDLAKEHTLSLGLQVSTVIWLVFSACFVFTNLLTQEYTAENLQPRRQTYPVSWWVQLIRVVILLVMFGIPVWNLFARASFHVARIDGQPVPGNSLGYLVNSIQRACLEYFPQTCWSLVTAGVCLLICLVLATGLAWLAKRRPRFRGWIVLLISVCFALPGPVIGTGLLKVYEYWDANFVDYLFNRTMIPVIFVDVIVCLPIAVVLFWFVFSNVPVDSEEQMETEGIGPLKRFWQLGLLANPGPMLGVALLCFVVAYGELSATQMVLPPGVETVPRLTLGLMHAGVNQMTAALTIVNVGAILCVSLVGWWFVSLKWRTGR